MRILHSEGTRMQRLLEEKLPKTQIARHVGCSRQAIYYRLKALKEPRAKQKRASKLDPFKAYIETRLQTYDLPSTVLLEEIKKQGYTGGITILKEFVAPIKMREVQRVVDRFETEPGRQAQIDFADCGMIEHEGVRRHLSLLVVVLGFSRFIWGRFLVSTKRPVLMAALEDCFRELGGVPRELLVDNMRQIIGTARTAEREAVVQQEFMDFARHWDFDVEACPAYWPRAKGKVERSISYIKRSFLEGLCFADLEDLNGQFRTWLSGVANVRVHGTTKVRPVDRLGDDQRAFRPIGSLQPYGAALVEVRRVDHDSLISFRGVRYSVHPSVLGHRRGERVEVHVGTDEHLRIYHGERLVGTHRLQPPGSPAQEDLMHAQARRELRGKPSTRRPRGKTPRFDQAPREEVAAFLEEAPEVQECSLNKFEAVSHGG